MEVVSECPSSTILTLIVGKSVYSFDSGSTPFTASAKPPRRRLQGGTGEETTTLEVKTDFEW